MTAQLYETAGGETAPTTHLTDGYLRQRLKALLATAAVHTTARAGSNNLEGGAAATGAL